MSGGATGGQKKVARRTNGSGWIGNVRDKLTVVLLGGLCEQLLDVLPILVGAQLTGRMPPVSSGGRRIRHLETEPL